MADFEPNTVEHTFSTGRTMIIRRSLPVQVLLFKAVENGDMEVAEGLTELFNHAQGGTNGDTPDVSIHALASMTRGVVETMFVEPRVHWNAEDVTDGGIAVEDLHTSEINEVMELAMEAVSEAGRFRGDEPGDGGGDDGEGVGKKPKRAAGAAKRKR